ncbi:RES family NAD+ phosphorylase [Rugamonas sp. CCM 8940]|uniref:RES family NAD+ phosphorylase n=1 Tax=Rugamonas sp. CCM 8940 TaxID=2765359 RepID=UPI0018F75B6C|nr:RES family NAD+ phosphorylase [Rugamonas sp. CCM 8940]MBJ7314136.1 RES family NAD+ phosphorylase [Rugamonas sp. CCM 8940]
MTASVWRIAVEAPAYSANDVSGAGAARSGGRWNSRRTAMVYCSSSIALAMLETLGFARTAALPLNRFLVRIDIPDLVWSRREVLAPPPGGWDAVPAGRASMAAGDAWASSRRSALLLVPSVIVPEEFNVLLNPGHADAVAIVATTVRRWAYDARCV